MLSTGHALPAFALAFALAGAGAPTAARTATPSVADLVERLSESVMYIEETCSLVAASRTSCTPLFRLLPSGPPG